MKTNLQKLREINKLSQAQMGAIIGKSQQYYQRYENGKSKLPIELAIIYANHFEVSLDYLCDRPYTNNIGYIKNERKEVLKQIIELDDDSFKKLSGYVSALLDN